MKQNLKELREQLFELTLKQKEYLAQHRQQSPEIAGQIREIKTSYAKAKVNEIRGVKSNGKH